MFIAPSMYNKEELTRKKLMNRNGLLHFVYKKLKFGMTSLFPYVIRLPSRIIDKNLEITSINPEKICGGHIVNMLWTQVCRFQTEN